MKYIRERIDALYHIIKDSNEELAEIRKNLCDHKETRIGNYGDFRLNSPSRICTICDGFICFVDADGNETKSPFLHPTVVTTTSVDKAIDKAMKKAIKKQTGMNPNDIL